MGLAIVGGDQQQKVGLAMRLTKSDWLSRTLAHTRSQPDVMGPTKFSKWPSILQIGEDRQKPRIAFVREL